jgi:DNA-binding protein
MNKSAIDSMEVVEGFDDTQTTYVESPIMNLPEGATVRIPGKGIEIKNKRITTPGDYKSIVQIKKPFRIKGIDGYALTDDEINVLNRTPSYPPLYVEVHEDDHQRFEEYLTFDHPVVNELNNRKIADYHYKQLTGKNINSAGDYEEMIKNHLFRNVPSKEIENIMREIRAAANLDFQRIKEMKVDVTKDYKLAYVV